MKILGVELLLFFFFINFKRCPNKREVSGQGEKLAMLLFNFQKTQVKAHFGSHGIIGSNCHQNGLEET